MSSPGSPRRARGVALVAVAIGLGACGGEDLAPLPEGFQVLAARRGDLDGDGREETVRLIGHAPAPDSAFRDDLCLLIGDSAGLWPLPSAAAAGYDPVLALADATGDGRDEIVITAATGGSGGLVAAAVVAAARGAGGWDCRTVFEAANGARPRLGGALADGFRATLEVTAPGLAPRTEPLDLRGRRAAYLAAGVYDSTGVLLRPIAIWGDAVTGLSVVTPAESGPGLRLVQQVRGATNADRLAEVTTVLVWRDGGWQAAALTVRPLD